VQRGRHVIDQVKDRLVDGGRRDEMVIVKDKQHRPGYGRDVVDQHGHGYFRGRQLGGQREVLADFRMDSL
jgi:hypothetical protein